MFDSSTHVLVVDDMKTMRKLVQRSCKELGFAIFTEAEDGAKAWEALTSATQPIGLIISDWNMPNCSGLDFLKRVRSNEATKNIPFMLLTAESEATQVQAALAAGVDNYLVKPFTTESLSAKLAQVQKKRSAA